MDYLEYFNYNSLVILSFFFISLIALILNKMTKGKSNKVLFISRRSSLLNPFTYLRLFTHVLGHENWEHFRNNFLYILLIGPMIEEKYGSINLLIMVIITAGITGLINMIVSKKGILGASGISFMLILLSSLVNLQNGKIPLTLILIFVFYIVSEVMDGMFKKDNVSHFSHLLGAVCGFVYGFFFF
ncbi:MAG: rhomboid family intramembrane serine protease [Bacilli bacterium]|nr:rhomboid family intramembrane serine protease [Bacilli bacterium]